MSRITINGNSYDTGARLNVHGLSGVDDDANDASKSDYVLVQTKAALSRDQKRELSSKGLVLHEYVSEDTYLYGYKGTDLEDIRSLPFVTWANVYMQSFKVAPDLKSAATAGARQDSSSRSLETVDITFHKDVDSSSGALNSAIAAAANVEPSNLTIGRQKIRLSMEKQHLTELAAIDGVQTITKVHPVKLHNNIARTVMNADVVVNGTPYKGAGQVVAVADTGFDKGSTTDTLPAFTGRVSKLYALGRPDTARADDPAGHGTHVCGSVLGDGHSSKMGGKIQGTAPSAVLVMQSLNDSDEPEAGLGGIPSDLADLFEPPYLNDNARVHTNSWGSSSDTQLPYDDQSREIDTFVWDHPDMVICFAAGNDGMDRKGAQRGSGADGIIDLGQIGSEAAAKNCITVGASENNRPDITLTYGGLDDRRFPKFAKAPIHNDVTSNHPEGMAAFSSRGPTAELRFKPDVVAPGTSVLSTHSRAAPPESFFGTSTDKDWFFSSGTSMATPLVAGCVAVLRETLVKNGTPSPSAALVKALLINGADDLIGQYTPSEAGPSPNNNSGFGRVNLANSVIIPGQDSNAGFGEGGPLEQDDEDTITITIPSKDSNGAGGNQSPMGLGATLKITLVWSDPPGPYLQSNLNLIVIGSHGVERHGNMGDSKEFDQVNNVEQVIWTNMPSGEAKVVIRAARTTVNPQPYAYAWRIR